MRLAGFVFHDRERSSLLTGRHQVTQTFKLRLLYEAFQDQVPDATTAAPTGKPRPLPGIVFLVLQQTLVSL
jgi:hypothetical protein